MAVVWKFRRNAVDVDLSAGFDAGWNTSVWNPSVAAVTGNRLPPLVTETMRLLADDTSHDNLAAEFQTLDNYRWLARSYIQDRTEQYPVWLHAKMNAETGERRALVYDCGLRWLSAQTDTCDLVERSAAAIQATVVRGPFWEDTTVNSKTAGSNLSVLNGVWDYSGVDIVGDAPARIENLQLSLDDTTEYTQAWIGFRSANKHNTLANFVNLWESELGTNRVDAADSADATASPGGVGNTRVTISFATATWAKRLTHTLSGSIGGTANLADNWGRHVILLRAKVDAGTIAEIHIRKGLEQDDDDNMARGPTRELSASTWTILNMGYVTFPINSLQVWPVPPRLATMSGDSTLDVWAQRTGGAGNLYLDCIILIPADELFLYAANLYIDATSDHRGQIAQSPAGQWGAASTLVAAAFVRIGTLAYEGFGVPIGDGRAYVVLADGSSINDITHTFDSTLTVYPRWYNLRGAE